MYLQAATNTLCSAMAYCQTPCYLLIGSLVFSERELKFMFAMSSAVRLSVVCNVRAPYSGDSNFRQYFYAKYVPPWPSMTFV